MIVANFEHKFTAFCCHDTKFIVMSSGCQYCLLMQFWQLKKKKNQGYALVCHFNLPIGIKFGKQMYYKMKSSCI